MKIRFYKNPSFIFNWNCEFRHRDIEREDMHDNKTQNYQNHTNMKIFIQCYPVYSFWTLGCNAISWRAVKTHILKTWRHAKCTTFDIYEIVSWTRTRYQGCRKSFWFDVDFAANKKLVQKKKKHFSIPNSKFATEPKRRKNMRRQ